MQFTDYIQMLSVISVMPFKLLYPNPIQSNPGSHTILVIVLLIFSYSETVPQGCCLRLPTFFLNFLPFLTFPPSPSLSFCVSIFSFFLDLGSFEEYRMSLSGLMFPYD